MADKRISKRRFLSEQDIKLIDYTRKIIKQARELLDSPAPDTFLGRETHSRFPENKPD
ncbi:hypothetical protein Q2941_26000 [Bradyrhizobium sp. UFLA05-153]